ncbi:MAG: ROK family glucokinase [Eubacteriales bacterium]
MNTTKYIFGVDVGGTAIKFGLFEKEGQIIDSFEVPTPTENNGINILPTIEKVIMESIYKNQIEKNEILGAGIGVPGPVNDSGVVLKCVNLGWGVTPVKDILEEKLGFQVEVGNDANVAALGEMWQGSARGRKNVVMVTLGTGVGGGIIIDEKVVAGTNGAGGEIGHIKMKRNETEFCGCGKKGCLEQYASATGIVRLAKSKLDSDDLDTLLSEILDLQAKDIFDCAKKNDKVALELVAELGKYLGMALANISCVCDPQIFIIGGGVSKAGDILINSIRRSYIEYAFHASEGAEFKIAELGNEAGIYGAAKMVLGA